MELPVSEAPTSDPFERLPEHVLHRILSLIPGCREAARTTLISRSWWRVWSSFPVFDFDFMEFVPDRRDNYQLMSHDELLEVNDKFLGFVDRTVSRLRQQGIPLLRLKVWVWVLKTDGARALFDKWIGMALEDCVEELSIAVHFPTSSSPYSVPARVFTSDSLKTLTLDGVRFIDHLPGASTVNLHSLNSLEFRHIGMDDELLQKLLRGCPLLENLTLYQCETLKQMKISGVSKLRMLDVTGRPDRVEIDLLNLETLQLSVPSVADGIVLNGCRQLKHLIFMSVASQELLEELLSQFPLLESLTWYNSSERIRIAHPLLEKIKVLKFEKLKEIEINAPKLLSFRYSTWGARLPIIRMTNPAYVSNCEVEFKLYSNYVCDFIELRKSLQQSCAITSLSFCGLFRQVRVRSKDAMLASLPCDIGHLNLEVDVPQSSCAAILNGLLSICRPTTMRVAPRCDHNSTFLKFLCRKLANRENDMKKCLCSSHTKCWLHKLKGVDIERITKSDHRGPLDWTTLFDLLPTLNVNSGVCFRLHW